MSCKLCEQRGKTWEGSDPVCAFSSGVFASENWNCATMGRNCENDWGWQE